MEGSEILDERNNVNNENMKENNEDMKGNNEGEIKREIIEDYLNYKEISEAITKGNTTMNFYFEEEQNGNEYWEIQTLKGTKDVGIILLKSSLGDFYVNRSRKKGKLQYLNKEEREMELTRKVERLTEEIQEMKRKMNNDMNNLNEQMKEMKIQLSQQQNGRKNQRIMNRDIECYGCGERGHIRPNCPNINTK